MSYSIILDEIQKLPHYRMFACNRCGQKQEVYTLTIHEKCKHCGTEYKFRGIAPIGCEIEDVIDAVLEWLGTGSEFEDAMERKRVIDSSQE